MLEVGCRQLAQLSPCCMPFNKKYRSHLEVIASMLKAAKNHSVSRFSIMKEASTNSRQLKRYLKSLTEIGFIKTDVIDGHVLYRASDRGLAFLSQYNILQDMLVKAYAGPYPLLIVQMESHMKKRAL